MDDHGSSHPLLQSSPAAATLAYAWGYQQHPIAPFDEHPQLADTGAAGDHHQQLDAPELRRALVRALAELHASRAAHQAELRRVESEAARLAALVSSAAAERDELRRHCHSLLLLLHHQAHAQPPPPHTPSLHAASVQSAAAGGGGGGCTNAAAVMMNNENAPDAAAAACADETTTELEMALARRLPEKGRLVEAVVSAGPLLQTLLLAGPLPRWRHPPPPAPADIPPFNPGRHNSPLMADASNNSFSSASAGSSSPESNCSGGGPPPPPPPPVAHALPSFHMSPFCM